MLQNMKLFEGMNNDDITYIESLLEKKVYLTDDIICKESDESKELYLIINGKVDIIKKETKIGELVSGEHFGEMALIENKERSADVVANGEVEIFVLTNEKFFSLRNEKPKIYADILFNISKDLSGKLREISSKLQRIWEGYINLAAH